MNTHYIGLRKGISHRSTLVGVHPTIPCKLPSTKLTYPTLWKRKNINSNVSWEQHLGVLSFVEGGIPTMKGWNRKIEQPTNMFFMCFNSRPWKKKAVGRKMLSRSTGSFWFAVIQVGRFKLLLGKGKNPPLRLL